MNKKALFNLALIALAGSFGGLLVGYDTGIISGAQLFVTNDLALSPEKQGLLVAAAMIGAFIGVFLNGFLADRIGRKKVLGLLGLIYLVGCCISSNSTSATMLISARILSGIAIGMATSIVPMYLSELSPQKVRGLFTSLYQLSLTFGILVSYLTGYIFSASADWRTMLLSGIIPAIIVLFAFIFLSESPRWLILKGRDEEAKKVFEKIEAEEDVQQRIDEVKESTKNKGENEKVGFKKWMLTPVLIGVGIMFAQILTGINVIICYASKIFQMAGFADESSATKIAIIIGLVNFLMTFVAMYLSDKVGRKPLLLSGATIMGISMFLIAFSFLFGASLGEYQKWLAVISIIGFICSFAYSLGPVAWVIVSEIFPLEAKGMLMIFPVSANYLSNIFILLAFPVMVSKLSEGITFAIFGVLCVISLIFIYFMVPETKGLSLEKIEENWKNGVKPKNF